MKKALSAVLAVVLVLGVCFSVPMIASANDANDFTYELDDAQDPTGYIITGVKDDVTGTVEIPATYKPTGDITEFFPAAQEAVNLGEVTGVTVVINGEGDEDDHGTVTVTEETVETTTVTLEMAPEAGYELGDVTITSEQDTEVTLGGTGNTRTFVKAAGASYTVTVPFTAIEYNVTLTQPEVGGTISASPEKGVKGDEITLTAEAAPEYTFKEWIIVTGEGAEVTGNVLTIGTANVTVTAEFTKNTYNITFADGTTGVKAYDANGEVATAAPKGAVIEIKPDDAKKIVETVTVKDAEDNDIENLTVTGNKFTMPGEAVKVAATLVQGYAVNVAATENGTVKVDKSLAAAGDTVAITATPNEGYKIGTATVTAGQTPVTVNADRKFVVPAELADDTELTVTVTFVQEEYTITLPGTNNDGKVTNGEIAITSAKATYHFGDAIALTLTPAAGCELATLTYTYEGLQTPVAIEDETFSMPAKNIEINVTFAAKELPVVGIADGAFDDATGVTAFTVAEGQDLFVAENGVLFEKVAGTDGAPDTLKLIAFPAAYEVEVEEGEVATYTIPAKVPAETGLAVTEVADGAFQALGNVQYVFCADEDITSFDKHPAFYTTEGEGEEATKDNNKKLHLGMTTHEKAEDAEGEVTQDPNCTYTGVRTFYCKVCNVPVEKAVEPIDEEAHIPGAYEVETEGSCTVAEVKVAPCVLCDETRASVITSDIPGHTPATTETVIESTCKTLGESYYECTTCKAKLIKNAEDEWVEGSIPAEDYADHVVPDENVIDEQHYKAATCEEAGEKTGLCEVCGKEDAKVVIPQLEHEYEKEVISELTCTQDGLYFMVCKYCDEVDPVNPDGVTQKAEGHKASKIGDKLVWTVEKAATCSTEGLAVVKCSVCNGTMPDTETETYTRPINALGHTDDSYTWETTKLATCTEAGVSTGTCKTCDATTTKAIPATGHTPATEWTLKTDSTCKVEGKEVLLCTVCNAETAERAVAKKPHTVDLTATGEGGTTTITQAATHFETGLCDGKCTVCGDNVEDVVIPTTPHVFTVKNAEGEDVLATAEPLRETIGEGENAKTKPTCTDAGYVAVYCTIEGCNEYKEDTVAESTALGHNFDATYTTENKPATQAPTCEDDGYEYKWCKRCSDEEATEEDNFGYVEVKIDAVGHSFTRDAWVDGKANNCIESGYKAKHCSNAGCNEYDETTKVEVVASGHDYDELAWSTTAEGGKAPTCTEDGVEVNTCRIAGCPKPNLTRKVDKIAHNFTYEGAEKKTVNPTCSDEGYDYIKCNGCNEIQKSNVKSALGHDTTGNTAQVTAATCEADGVSKTACNRYFVNGVYDATANAENAEEKGAVKCAGIEVKIDALGHFYSDEYSILDKATCEEPGEKARKCIRYGEGGCTAMTGKVEIPATDHTLDTEYKVIEGKEPTCQKAGSEARHCINEGCKYYDLETVRPVATVAHDWSGEWIIEKQPTCLEDGEGLKTKVCKNCTEEKEEVMPRLEHNTTNANTQRHEPSCTEPGYTYKECQNYIEGANGPYKCGYEVKIDVLDATGHKLSADDDDTYEEQEATCTKPGYKKGTCTECNELVTIDEVEKTGHKFSAEHTKVDATCQTEGSITGKCQIDGCDGVKDANGNVTEILPVKEHSFTKYVLVEDKLCTDANALVSVCDTCIEDTEKGLEKATDSKNNEEHISSGWVVNKEATCGTAGEMTDFCSVCRHPIDSSPIPATGKHNLKEIVTDDPECTKAPTCTEKGKRKVVCQNENCIEGTDGTYTQYTAVEVVEELGHDETDWVTSVAPTCTTKGYASSICQRCLATETKILIPLGHDLGQYIVDTPAACGKAGSQHKECSRCDYKTEAEPIAALEHNFVGNDCANKCGAKIYEYALVEGSTTDIIITKYNGSDENLVIPAVIDGYKVVAIGNRAFMKTVIHTTTTEVEGEDGETTTETTTTVEYIESDFTSLTIPASIAKIGDYAFANSKLTLVNIPATVTTIGKCAFGYDVVITMVPDLEEGETPAEDEEVELVEKIVPTKVAGFTIYGVKPSAAETYAKQDATKEDDDFTFVEVENVYDVVIDEEETNIVEVDNGVLFKEFAPVVENDDSTKIVNQIKAVIELPENSDYTVDVEATLSGVINEGEDDETPYAFYGTGSKILIKDGDGKVIDEIVVIIEGDVNGDSVVDALDCMLIQLASQDKSALEGVYLTAGDYDCDGEIEVADFSGVVNQIFGVAEDDEIDDTTEATTEGTSDESGDDNQGSGNDNQGSGDDNQGSGNDNQGLGDDNQGSGDDNQGSGEAA